MTTCITVLYDYVYDYRMLCVPLYCMRIILYYMVIYTTVLYDYMCHRTVHVPLCGMFIFSTVLYGMDLTVLYGYVYICHCTVWFVCHCTVGIPLYCMAICTTEHVCLCVPS